MRTIFQKKKQHGDYARGIITDHEGRQGDDDQRPDNSAKEEYHQEESMITLD